LVLSAGFFLKHREFIGDKKDLFDKPSKTRAKVSKKSLINALNYVLDYWPIYVLDKIMHVGASKNSNASK
jgi:hypothetical protein